MNFLNKDHDLYKTAHYKKISEIKDNPNQWWTYGCKEISDLINKYNHYFLFKDVLKEYKSKVSFHRGSTLEGIQYQESILFKNIFKKKNCYIGSDGYYCKWCILYPQTCRTSISSFHNYNTTDCPSYEMLHLNDDIEIHYRKNNIIFTRNDIILGIIHTKY